MTRALFCLLLLIPVRWLVATESESMPERTLRQILAHEKDVLGAAAKQGEKLDEEALRTQAQSIAHDYDRLLADNPNFALAYADYGYFLRQVGMQKEAIGMLLKANQLDPNIPMVKNQIGNYLAETGKPVDAAEYFLAAVRLSPNEPLYHYQLGRLLTVGRDSFLKSGEWTRAALDHAMQDAFKRAHELAPDNFGYAYAYAMSFYDLENPDWDEALKQWSALEDKAQSPLERQTMRLHAAHVFVKMGKLDHAKLILATIDEPELQVQKQRVLAELNPAPKK